MRREEAAGVLIEVVSDRAEAVDVLLIVLRGCRAFLPGGRLVLGRQVGGRLRRVVGLGLRVGVRLLGCLLLWLLLGGLLLLGYCLLLGRLLLGVGCLLLRARLRLRLLLRARLLRLRLRLGRGLGLLGVRVLLLVGLGERAGLLLRSLLLRLLGVGGLLLRLLMRLRLLLGLGVRVRLGLLLGVRVRLGLLLGVGTRLLLVGRGVGARLR
uniref:Uncharacterized protein n=1 Tax=Streptomyces auratus AGR0001 TaxID=1160718 RepID=J1RKY1_9ACTN